MVKKIVIIGPESTGKSTLCSQLAAHYSTLWCPEFARNYLLEHGTSYTFTDLLTIAKGQWQLEKNCQERASRLLLVDTDQYVTKVWCEYVFNQCHTWILNRIVDQSVHLYLLCKPDLPWVPDALREYPDEKPRQQLYHIYKDILVNQQVPWVEISGNYDERIIKAITAIDLKMASW